MQKEDNMINWMENLMILALCSGVAALAVRFGLHGCRASFTERLLVICMGAGFLIGLIAAIIRGLTWEVMLYCAGVMLSYTAAVLSFPDRKKD